MTASKGSATVSVPSTAKGAVNTDDETPPPNRAKRTAPLSVIVGALGSVQNAIFPAIAAAFGSGIDGYGLLIGLGVGLAFAVLGSAFSYISWKRLTYTIGATDIRVESGVLSRSARSVPYERIQDVSLEQKLLPRLLGLVSVKFETGAGGSDDLALTYLVEAEGERLRELVRERRDQAQSDESAPLAADTSETSARGDDGEELFSMGPRRLFTYGLFEFSLAVFAVLAGVLQYIQTLFDIEIWDVDFWRELAQERGGWLLELGAYAQALGVVIGLIGVFLVGVATGIFRTFSREWGFRLERTARGFRRRRGLFTRTDVVMPVHRVQGLTIGTRFIRYRFGWHSLKFVSLAQDAGSSSHVVAPFAQLDELDPIVKAAGFARPREDAQWHRATMAYRNVSFAVDFAVLVVIAIIAGTITFVFAPDWTLWAVFGVLALTPIDVVSTLLSWRFKRHTLDADQITSTSGLIAPTTRIATRVKLHSVEIVQGPLARKFGYATLHLGMAGGEMAIEGIELQRAREVRARILDTIAQTDFSELESQTKPEAA